MRNPKWSRDELIVTLDFYLRHAPAIPEKGTKQIAELSQRLNILQTLIGGRKEEKFRNANGVYMKLMNFRRFDPNYHGKGLERGGKDEEVVWNLYANKKEELSKIAYFINQSIETRDKIEMISPLDQDEEEGNEGQILSRIHRYRERSRDLVDRKKSQFFGDHGSLHCEACGFDFLKIYGERGNGFIECHHTKPVSQLEEDGKTKVSDLVVLCSNCHRMVHRKKPWLKMDELKELIQLHER
jgi:5-methylcytosine-specific restriction protein A